MNITLVLAVYNNLELTKKCYNRIRIVYPKVPLIISSGGSTDGTKEWLENLLISDNHLTISHNNERLSFSDTYNVGINLVNTEKLVLIHNDMVIGHGFLESLERLLTEDTLLSYTTIEPPIFTDHIRPGKVILDLGSSFDDFNYQDFNNYIEQYKDSKRLYDGAVFFMSGYKKMFEDVGMFDGFSFFPCFCEDDDFLIRAKLKGYKLKTTDAAITYHFVSQTSRFSEEFKNSRSFYEVQSNINFVRKWGTSIQMFNETKYWLSDKFEYKKFKMAFKTNNVDVATKLEPFFDIIDCGTIPEDFINNEQKNTNYDLKSKFGNINDADVVIYEYPELTDNDIPIFFKLRFILPAYGPGTYQIGNIGIEIKNQIS